MSSKHLLVQVFSLCLFFLSSPFAQAQVFLSESQLQENHFKFDKVDHSQPEWWKVSQEVSPNVWQAERLFNDYFAAHPREKSLQKKLFIRWLEEARLSVNAQGDYLPQKASAFLKTKPSQRSFSSTGTWTALGPNYSEKTTCGTTSSLTGGFCDRVYINPYNTDNLFAGYSYGGLWVSQDKGESWSLTDAAFANGTNTYANRDYYYGDIEASKINSALIFAATESGLLKSSNGGADWLLCPELNREDNPDTRPYYVAMSMTEENKVLATFGRSVYRSTDGGNSWTLVFDNSGGGSNHHFTSQYTNNSTFGIYERNYNFFGLEGDHDNPDNFYLGTYNSSNEPCIYKSTDGGASFSFLVNLNTATGIILPNNMHLRTIPAQTDRFYVFGHFAEGNIYHFQENGVLASENLLDSYIEAGDINWSNEKSIYTGFYGASSIMKSTDGGLSFTDMTSGYGGCPKYVHPDVRDIDVVGDMVLIGSDGGIALSTDAMENVYSIGREISSIDLWGFSSSAHSDIISAGCDHGPTKIRRFEGDNGWISRGGGDAGQTSVNQSNDRWIYFDHGYGIFRTELAEDQSFLSTEAIDIDISLHRLTFHPHFYKTSYGINGTRVEVSYDNLSSFSTFQEFGETVRRVLIAPTDPNIFYVLLTNNNVQKSIDGGANWTTINPPTSVSSGQTNITDIAVGDDPNHLWASYGNWQTDAKILQSKDGGSNWNNITSPNLPATPVNQIVFQRGTDGGIYLAFNGQSGVYYRNNTMTQFESIGDGLPMLGYVRNIYAIPAQGKYRMGSSRGAWEHDLYETSTLPVAAFSVSSNKSFCHLTPIQFFQNCIHSSGPVTYEWFFPGGQPATSSEANPKVTYAEVGEYDVSLTITDEFGTKVSTQQSSFIQSEASICAADDQADKMVDLKLGETNRIALNQVPINGDEFTITAWVKLHELQKSFSQIVSFKKEDERFGLGFAFKGYTANTNLIFTSPDIHYGVESNIDLEIDQWHYLAVTYSPTEVKVYRDGAEPWVRTGDFRSMDFSVAPFFLNSDIHNQGGDFHGQIDELAFYDYAMTQEEIREERHLVKKPGVDNGLVTYYQFNQYDSQENTLYELVAGHPSLLLNKLVDSNSPIPVADGVSFRLDDVNNGKYDFSAANLLLNFTASANAPYGEVVVSRLDASPFQSPANVLQLSPQYWVVNNYGTEQSNFDAEINFISPVFADASTGAIYTLHKRTDNASGVWTEAGNYHKVEGEEVIFGNVEDLGQMVLSSNIVTENDDPITSKAVPLLRISPNPASDHLEILFAASAKGVFDLSIFDNAGKRVTSGQLDLSKSTRLQVDLSEITSGVYFLLAKGEMGQVESVKFVVE